MMLPEFTTLSQWGTSLFIDFPNDNIPILVNENDWKSWGNFLIQENSFDENNAPGTDDFDHWQSWAQALFYAMENT